MKAWASEKNERE